MIKIATQYVLSQVIASMLAIGFLLFTSAGCELYHIKTPTGFVKKENPHTHVYLAVSSSLSTLGIKRLPNWANGDTNYWFKVVHEDFISNRAYEPIDDPKTLTNADGVEGKYAVYTVNVNDEIRNYMFCIFALPLREFFFVIEYQATQEVYEEEKTAIIEALATLEGDYGGKLED